MLRIVLIPIIFVTVILVAYIGCFVYIETSQWLKSPDVHYDWWHFLFCWDVAYTWLWYTNFQGWLMITVVYAAILSLFVFIMLD